VNGCYKHNQKLLRILDILKAMTQSTAGATAEENVQTLVIGTGISENQI
jgi:hypothetical protein